MIASAHDNARAVAFLESQGDFKVLQRMPAVPSGKLVPGDGLVKVVILDTETTGVSPWDDKVIEIGAISRLVDIKTGCWVGDAEVRSWLEDPGFPLEPYTVALTGLTDADLKGQAFSEVEIAEFLSGAALVIAHSASFDRPFFEQRFPALNDFPWGCSLTQVNWNEAGAGSSKLEFLAFKLGRFYEAHRALPDCQALSYVLEHFKLPSGATALQHLVARSAIRQAQGRDPRVHAGDVLWESEICEAVRVSSILEQRLMDMREIGGARLTDSVNDRVRRMLDQLKADGYLVESNVSMRGFTLTGKVDYIYQLIGYIAANTPHLSDEDVVDAIDDETRQARIEDAAQTESAGDGSSERASGE